MRTSQDADLKLILGATAVFMVAWVAFLLWLAFLAVRAIWHLF